MTENESHVRSVTRALEILKRVSVSENGLGVSDLARSAGLAVSTTHRLLTTMQNSGFVSFNPETAKWHIGREAFSVGAAYVSRRDFVAPGLSVLRRLRDETRETANLGVLDGEQLVTISQVESREVMRAISMPGGRVPATCSAMGKAILAEWPDEQIERFCVRNGFAPLTPRSHKSLGSLMEDITHIRRNGFAVDDQEHVRGVRCIGAAVRSPQQGVVCAISVSGVATRLTPERIDEVADRVMAAAAALQETIGGQMLPD